MRTNHIFTLHQGGVASDELRELTRDGRRLQVEAHEALIRLSAALPAGDCLHEPVAAVARLLRIRLLRGELQDQEAAAQSTDD